MTTSLNASNRMPALYIGHGAPPLLDDPVWSAQLAAAAADLAPARTVATRVVDMHCGLTCLSAVKQNIAARQLF